MVSRIYMSRGRLCILGLFLILVPATVWAQEPVLKLGRPEIQNGKVVVGVELRDFFNGESLTSLQSGMPGTLVFNWTIFQQRDVWSDPEIVSGQVRNRIYFDVLEEQYHLFNHQGRPLGACDALAGVTREICRKEAMVLSDAGPLKKGEAYYVEMEVTLEILNDKQVRGFEDWLWGEGREGTDSVDQLVSQEEDSGFSSGLSDMALGVVLRVAGISDANVQGQSVLFYGGS